MEVSSKGDVVEVHGGRKGHISCSTSSAGVLSGEERLAVIEEGDLIITDESLPALKSNPVRHRRTQSQFPPMVQLTYANEIKPKTCHRYTTLA